MRNKNALKNVFFKKILYTAIIQLFILTAIVLTAKNYQLKNQTNKIAADLFISDRFSRQEIMQYITLKNKNALDLTLYDIGTTKKIDHLQFYSALEALKKFKQCIAADPLRSSLCQVNNNNFVGITPLSYDNKLLGYVIAEKYYDFPLETSTSHDLIIILFTILAGFCFNVLFGFFSLQHKIKKNTLALIRMFTPYHKEIISGVPEEIDIEEYKFIANKFLMEKQKIIQLQKEKALSAIATQVAHDIRSPLLVLKRILNDLPSLPEKKRIDARNAIQRVTDIANNLLSQYKQEKNYNDLEVAPSSEPVAIMLESIVSEKRIQVTDLGVEIMLKILANAYDAFVQVDIAGFKRVLSNLMNNAIDAVKDKQGQVTLALKKSDSSIYIDIKDNGCGIPKDKLLSVLEEGVSFGKKEGSGLGLPYAVSKISEWHGDYSLTSEPGEGTQFEIILPECKPAEWFRSEIVIEKNGAIVILDDDNYIHQIWDERFPAVFLQKHQLKIFHFNNPQNFIEFCQGETFNKTIFLLDYELGKYQETGLTLVKTLNIGQYATLVTSRYEDEDVRENCKQLGMKIIPKSFTELTPIRIFEPTEIIFIDDEEVIGEFWKDSAESAGKSISIFQDPRDFMRIVHLYPKDVLIYMDSSLGNGLKGEDFAKILYEQGYQNVILATGYPKEHFAGVTWVKDIIGKEPPWG